MMTYQDFSKETDRAKAIARVISEHEASEAYRIAVEADLYDRQKNKTITEFVQKLFTSSGATVENFVASNNKKASGFFNLLNTQRNSFLLGNGVSFAAAEPPSTREQAGDAPGAARKAADWTKHALGPRFDQDLMNAGYYALIHGVSFCFWNHDRLHVFKLTEFAPLWDEETGALRAGVRYWCIDRGNKPVMAVLYEECGVTRYKSKGSAPADFEAETDKPLAYKTTLSRAPADAEATVVGQENYETLPIVPLYGSRLHQSTLVGMKESIDSYDIIANGWCNDVRDCAQVYWLLENYGGMSEEDIAKFRDRLLTMHIAAADTSSGGKATPYTQEIPYQSRDALLTRIKEDIYRDFGGLDAHALSGGSMTATAIKAAYEALNQKADDFEMQVIDCVQGILRLIGIEDTPVFKRSVMVNELEQVQIVMMEADVLDDETLLRKLPNVTPDEVPGILARRQEEEQSRFLRETSLDGEG